MIQKNTIKVQKKTIKVQKQKEQYALQPTLLAIADFSPLLTNTIFVVKYTLCLLHKKSHKKVIKSIAIYKQTCYNKNIAKGQKTLQLNYQLVTKTQVKTKLDQIKSDKMVAKFKALCYNEYITTGKPAKLW